MEPSTKLMIFGGLFGLSALILTILFLFDYILEASIFLAGLCIILMVFPGLLSVNQRILAAFILGVDVMLVLYRVN